MMEEGIESTKENAEKKEDGPKGQVLVREDSHVKTKQKFKNPSGSLHLCIPFIVCDISYLNSFP